MRSVSPGDLVAGKYRVERVLGEGGMGVVVLATHEQLDQRVALKFLLPSVVAQPEVVARFLREARAAVKIHSEHVARVIDVGTLDTGAPYMVMEFLEGEDLAQALERRGPLAAQEAVGYLLEACEAIAEAHALGVVHRDLKPGNLFLARRPSGAPVVKVLDFGISKAPLSSKEQALTNVDAVMGSPAYMSPEQMRASRDVDPRSDIWSLGVVLFELLTQRVPFQGETMAALVAAILQDRPPPLRSLRGDAPSGLQAVIERCLEKDPARRFSSVAELARALVPLGPPRCEVSLERIEHVLGPASTAFASTAMATATAAPAISTATSTGGRGRVVASALLGMATAGAVAYLALRTPGTPASSPGPQAVAPSATVIAPDVPATVAPPSIAVSAAAPAGVEAPATAAPAPQPARPRAPTRGLPAAAPTCKIVSYFDADGNKHFKKECP
jgi:hypothetical protein